MKTLSAPLAVAIVGMGPRGISVIERLAAHLHEHPSTPPITLHLIDDAEHGAGRIWETDQTRTLCMNTLAGAVTLFTEPESTLTAPALEGPILYEWIQLLRGDDPAAAGISDAKVELFRQFPPTVDRAFATELDESRPESHPSRALYGAYLRWVLTVALAQLPEQVQVVHHFSRATDIADAGDHDVLTLADGSQVAADKTVLAYGWQVPAANEEEQRLAAADLNWVRPDNPVEQPVEEIPAGQKVLVRGLGMGFFDVMALVTINRGGEFVADDSARGGLRYQPSGREPQLVVSSGRGYPYLPKSQYHSLPPKADLSRFKAALADLGDDFDFGAEVLPALVRDAYAAYYPERAAEIDTAELHADTLPALAAELTAALDCEFRLDYWMNPLAAYAGDDPTGFIAAGLERDIAESQAGRDSRLKAALWAISAARKPASIAGSEGRMSWASRTGAYREFMAFGQMVGSGPPLFRTQQLLALIDAGLVTFLGDHPHLEIGDAFTLRTRFGAASSDWLVDAWMHQPDVRHAVDPMSVSLQARTRPFHDHGHPTGSPETTWQRRTVHPDGAVDERLHIIGIPTYAQWPDTTISPMPGTDPLMLQETDRTAGDLLA
ncbi:FAD/NAD(P)-binding protein [Corynebacterium sp. 32222D000AT]|nr:FAD/NAD(P)-binding protein [Mycobacteriaceae bacterium]MDY5828284.1 FAD/NAD(P)-binding protein [Corynebacterium sp.]